MKRLTAILCLFLLTGCGTPIGRGSRLLPWNWFAPDRAGQLASQQKSTDVKEDQVTAEAHRDLKKTVDTLKADPAPNKFTSQALHFSMHGLGLLDQVNPIPFAQQQTDYQLVLDLLSDNAAIRTAAMERQAKDEAKAAGLVRDLDDSRRREAELTIKLQASDERYQAEAETSRKWKFYIYAIVGGWILLQLLSGLSRLYPSLAPVSRIAGMVAAPALHAAYERVTSAVGEAIANAGDAASTLRDHLEKPLDATDKAAIRTKFEAASR